MTRDTFPGSMWRSSRPKVVESFPLREEKIFVSYTVISGVSLFRTFAGHECRVSASVKSADVVPWLRKYLYDARTLVKFRCPARRFASSKAPIGVGSRNQKVTAVMMAVTVPLPAVITNTSWNIMRETKRVCEHVYPPTNR